jgi:hypothetical protein
VQSNGNMEARELVSDAIKSLPQQMWIFWCRHHQFFPCIHKLKTMDTYNQTLQLTKLDTNDKLLITEIHNQLGPTILVNSCSIMIKTSLLHRSHNIYHLVFK